ncbi:protein QUIRKY-like [Chenopodium quinoa]|uniref:protein QUIRKY-like n=1 Tax=Chenopodium quinoa TaxID=63459 RepID=UPI000B792D32|nr:protein QUIRKY-like [Chenopodium quinoa]
MADTSNGRKLVVEICNAKNLMPKDGQGTASAFVMVDFDGQRRRTKTITRDLNPQWDEKLEFVVHNAESMDSEVLELNIYNDKKTGKRSNFLGKVKIGGAAFAKLGSESLIYYPLEKRSVFSQIKGEIGLKVWYEDPPSSPAAAEVEKKVEEEGKKAEVEEKKDEEKKPEVGDEMKEAEVKEGEGKDNKVDVKEQEKKPQEENPPPAAKDEGNKEGDHPPPPPPPDQAAEVVNPPVAENVKVGVSEKKNMEVSLASASVTGGGSGSAMRSDLEVRAISGSDRRHGTGSDLVDRMPFLYVRVIKAKLSSSEAESLSFAKLVIGTHSIKTTSEKNGKDWDQVFAFDKEGLNSSSLEVSVWTVNKKEEKEGVKIEEKSLGTVSFDLQEVPKRVPPDSPLAPQWYTLEGSEGTVVDVMVAVWIGTQTDEAFQEAWQSDSGGLIAATRAKVYLSPKLWYLRVTVIQTQDLQLGSGSSEPKSRTPDLYVKAQLGGQVFKTGRMTLGSTSPTWNEDLVFVAAEPFDPFLVVTVDDVTSGQSVGFAKVHVASIERRTDNRVQPKSRWFNLVGEDEKSKPYAGRIHLRTCIEGGYHVLDEAAHVTSDVRASAKQLAKPPIGLLEVGIRGANNLLPVKTRDGTRGTTDAYVVAKYGPKWVRTRTILDRFNPRWNEQYTWDVYDPCTVVTIGVFDNGRYSKDETNKPGKDIRIGKLRLRLSALDANRVYLNTYPLTVLLPGGARRMGEIEISLRFTCSSWISLLQAYSSPMLPRMHYVCPLGRAQQDILRHTAMRIVTARLARSEPPLGLEVVQYMLDSDTHIWSMRKSKVNWFRVVSGLSKVATLARWLNGIRTWAHTPTTILVHIVLIAIVVCPHLVLPTFFMYAFLILAFRIRYRAKVPLSMDPRISCVDVVSNDELDEEFDGLPTTRSHDVVRVRYDRLRALAGRAQSFLGDMAAQWERVEALYNWRDPRATGIFLVFCLIASIAFYVVPFKAFVLGSTFYYLRHPKFRGDMPSVPANFFRRLPSLSDQIL